MATFTPFRSTIFWKDVFQSDTETGVVIDWSELVRQHGRLVFGVAWRILGHTHDVEDVVQEVFLEAYGLHQRQLVKHWSALLRRLATLRSLDRLRRRKPWKSFDGLWLTVSTAGPEDEAVGRELQARLRQAIGQLSPREAAVFCLRYFEELSYQEIADTIDVSMSAVKTALHKSRTKLQSLLVEARQGE